MSTRVCLGLHSYPALGDVKNINGYQIQTNSCSATKLIWNSNIQRIMTYEVVMVIMRNEVIVFVCSNQELTLHFQNMLFIQDICFTATILNDS